MDWFNELQRKTVSPEIMKRLFDAFGDFDVVDLLSKVAVPALVLHAHCDAVVPFKSGRA
jgi:pimeloyl-ACP methyl ester carboxylesterase